MDAQTFLDNFATIADAPGGVKRLRDLVLELAVRGRLVGQTEEDEPASVGLDAVRADKGDTLADSIRGGASVPRVPEPAERDGELPPGWEWARVDDTGDYVNGLAFKNSDWKPAGIPIIRIQNLTNPSVPFNYADGPFPEDRMAHDGDILVSWSATLNAFRWYRGDAVVNQHIFKVIPDHRVVTTDYLFHLLRYCIRAMAESEAAHGLVMKHINRGPFLSHVISLPPLAEQERIVAKVDELMELCDDLEARRDRRHRATTRFRSSALHALTEAENHEDLRRAWERASSIWPTLADSPDALADLRRSVVRLAVTGHLGLHDPDDEPADLLLSRIEGDSLVDRSNAVVPVRPADEPWQLPATWRWVRFKQIVNFTAGRTPPTKDATYWSDSGGHHWVSIGDMPEGGTVTATARRVSARAADDIFRQQPDPVGTVLMSFKLTIGKVARLAVPAYHNEAIISIDTPFDETREYLFRTLPLVDQGWG